MPFASPKKSSTADLADFEGQLRFQAHVIITTSDVRRDDNTAIKMARENLPLN